MSPNVKRYVAPVIVAVIQAQKSLGAPHIWSLRMFHVSQFLAVADFLHPCDDSNALETVRLQSSEVDRENQGSGGNNEFVQTRFPILQTRAPVRSEHGTGWGLAAPGWFSRESPEG